MKYMNKSMRRITPNFAAENTTSNDSIIPKQMKKITFSLLILLLVATKAMASVNIPSKYYSEPVDGATFALYDVTNKGFYKASDSGLTDSPRFTFTLESDGNGNYYVRTSESGYIKIGFWNNQYVWFDGYGTTRAAWTFVPQGNKTFQLVTYEGNHPEMDGSTDIHDTFYLIANRTNASTDPAQAATVALVSEADYNTFASALSQYFSAPADGKAYKIYDVEGKTFIRQWDVWNAFPATTTTAPVSYTVKEISDGVYNLARSDGGLWKLHTDGAPYVWLDGNSNDNVNWTFTEEGTTRTYVIKNVSVEPFWYFSQVSPSNWLTPWAVASDAEGLDMSTIHHYAFITEDDYFAYNVEVTGEASLGDWKAVPGYDWATASISESDGCYEVYQEWNNNLEGTYIYKDVTLAQGVYRIVMKGYYRPSDNESEDNGQGAYFFVQPTPGSETGQKINPLVNAWSINNTTSIAADEWTKTVDEVTYYIPGTRPGAAAYFAEGYYACEPVYFVVTEETQTLRLGIMKEASGHYSCIVFADPTIEKVQDDVTLGVTISSAGYASLYYAATALQAPAGVEVFTIHSKGGKSIEFAPLSGNIPAGEPVLIKAQAGDYDFSLLTDTNLEHDADNQLRGANDDGSMNEEPVASLYYKFANDATHGLGFYWGDHDGGMFNLGITGRGYNKAYLVLPQASGAPARFPFSDIVDTATGISSLFPDTSPIGRRDQQGDYDLQGRRVSVNGQLNKGLYIVNGKKVLVK